MIGAGMRVHRKLGPGWDEWDYHRAMVRSLEEKGLTVASKARRHVTHRGRVVDTLEADLIVGECVIERFSIVARASSRKKLNAHQRDMVESVTDICDAVRSVHGLGYGAKTCQALVKAELVYAVALYDTVPAADAASLRGYLKHFGQDVGVLANFGKEALSIHPVTT